MTMSKLSAKDVEHVAKLSKLKLKKSEVEKFRKQLSEVINYINHLNEVNTNNVTPTSQTTGLENVFKNDEIATSDILSIDEALSGTENTHNNYFKVDMLLTNKS